MKIYLYYLINFPSHAACYNKISITDWYIILYLSTISYLVDVYRGEIHAEKDFGIYAVYISFFRGVMQGPIEKGEFLPNCTPDIYLNMKKPLMV